MEESKKIFRMNFIVQDNAAMTLEANLIKIVEAVILEKGKEELSLSQIRDSIEEDFELFFSEEEIRKVIAKKGKNIQIIKNKYYLKPEYRAKLAQKEDFKSQLDKFIELAIRELDLNIDAQIYSQLITDYLYFCFNSNKNSILNLINNSGKVNSDFSKNPDDIKLINEFLCWENDEKNKFVVNVVSFGYIYCTLTVKKDDLLSNKLFRGKKFILDANIIFRLAGINNDSRKRTIKSFVEKSNEVGVKLCYTTATLDEIKRVIVNKVRWIKSITGEQRPLDLSLYESYENDFYSLYCKWETDPANKYDDFLAFEKYITNRIMDVLDQLCCIDSINFQVKREKEFVAYVDSLGRYKNEHSHKIQTIASQKVDVTNILHVKELRSKNSNENIWTTNVFFISADQNLIKWASTVESGIPLVVLPSVWLTIMLRFCGRTSDDYKAFCSFLELRTHREDAEIDVYELLQKLSDKTDNNTLKEMIVKEVFENKNEYIDIADKDYEVVLKKAYDSISEKRQEQFDAEFQKMKKQNDEKEKMLQDYECQKYADDKFKIAVLVDKDCKKHFRFISFLNKTKKVLGFILFVALFLDTICAIKKRGFLYFILKYTLPDAVNGTGNCLSTLGIIWAIMVIVAGFYAALVSHFSSEKRESTYKEKREKYYKKLFNTES